MKLQLGEKIKALRKSKGCTQEELANALDITSQAVSRWELGTAYPDMELIPSVANYFGITIDELFGYEDERSKKVDKIIEKISSLHIKARSDDGWVDECLSILRQGTAEFPRNEKLLITLAETLYEVGYRKNGEHWYYDNEGYIRLNPEKHRDNSYWSEAVKLCENLIAVSHDGEIFTKAAKILISLYSNFGEYKKAAAFAQKMPPLSDSRELLLAASADGKNRAEYIGKALLQMVSAFSRLFIQGLAANIHNYEGDLPIEKINGLISLFYLVCEDGNFGEYHGELIGLYLYLSRVQWERGYHDEAFSSLYKALEQSKKLETILDGNEHGFTAALVKLVKCKTGDPISVSASLPDDWPFWCMPDCSEIEKEIKSDPRWIKWVENTKKNNV